MKEEEGILDSNDLQDHERDTNNSLLEHQTLGLSSFPLRAAL